jgi:hypothetical protein
MRFRQSASSTGTQGLCVDTSGVREELGTLLQQGGKSLCCALGAAGTPVWKWWLWLLLWV